MTGRGPKQAAVLSGGAAYAAYEVGVLWLGGTQPDTVRNGADTWLRWGLESFGLQQLYWAPAQVAAPRAPRAESV